MDHKKRSKKFEILERVYNNFPKTKKNIDQVFFVCFDFIIYDCFFLFGIKFYHSFGLLCFAMKPKKYKL